MDKYIKDWKEGIKPWIESVLQIQLEEDPCVSLKSGEVLCDLLNALKPNSITKKILRTKQPFKQRENIEAYIMACRKYLPDHYMFMTVDLHEERNMNQVLLNLLNLKREMGFGIQKETLQAQVNDMGDDQTTSSDKHKIETKEQKAHLVGDVSRIGSGRRAGHANVGLEETGYGKECCICHTYVTAGMVSALDRTWHPKCFNCKKCGLNLHNKTWYTFKDHPYCDRCIFMVNPQKDVKGVVKE